MKSLRGMALRLFSANKFTIFSSIISIAISVSLVVTMVLFILDTKSTLSREINKMYGEMDLSIGYNVGDDQTVTKELLNKIEHNNSIEKVSKVFITHLKVDELDAAIYTIGAENDYLSKSRYHFTEYLSENSIIMTKRLADSLNLDLGDKVLIESQPFVLVETIKDFSATPDLLVVSHQKAKELITPSLPLSEATYLLLKVKNEVDPLSVANQIREYDNDLRIDIKEQNPDIKSNINSLEVFIYVLSGLILIVTSFLTISNFEMLLYKLNNQFAIIRSIGGTTEQVKKMIFFQSSLITSLGSLLGYIIALLLYKYLNEWLLRWLGTGQVQSDVNIKVALYIALVCGIILQMFLIIPVLRNSKILPLNAIINNEAIDFKGTKLRKTLGYISLSLSVFFTAFGKTMPSADKNGVFLLLLAAFLILIALMLLFPIYLPAVLRKILPIVQNVFGQETYVSIKNLIPQVRKNTFVILSISSLMVVLVFGSVMLNTIKSNEASYIIKQFPTSIVINSRLYDSNINYRKLNQEIVVDSNVNNTIPISTMYLGALKNGEKSISFDYSLGDFLQLNKQGLIQEIPNPTNSVVVTNSFAERNDLKLNDNIQLGIYSDITNRFNWKGNFVVGSIISETMNGAEVYMDWSNKDFYTKQIKLKKILVDSDNPKETVKYLDSMVTKYPELKIDSLDKSLDLANNMFYQRWSLFIVVLVSLLCCTLVGIFNSITNNIYSKRKEYAILRTMGVSPNRIVKVILTQVLVFLSIGIIIGIVVGMVITLLLSLVDPTPLSINLNFIVLIPLAIIVIGILIFGALAYKIKRKMVRTELNYDNR